MWKTRLLLINGILAAIPIGATNNNSCKHTHLLPMRLELRLKLDVVFNGAGRQIVVQDSRCDEKSCKVFSPNCVCPSVFITASEWGFVVLLYEYFYYAHTISCRSCVYYACDSLFRWVCLCFVSSVEKIFSSTRHHMQLLNEREKEIFYILPL